MIFLDSLWKEIKANDAETAKFLRDMKVFDYKLSMFRWLKEPKHVFCKYERHR